MADCVESLRTAIADYEEALALRRKDPAVVLPERPWSAYVRLSGELQRHVDGHNDELRARSPCDRDLAVTREILAHRSLAYSTVRELCGRAAAHGT